MKKIYFTFAFLFLIQFSFSQSLAWAKQLGGTGADGGNAITVDGSSNAYSTGTFVGTVDLDPGPGTATYTSAGTQDIYISKLDVNGNFVWALQIGGSGSDVAKDIISDAAGNIYLTGWFNGTVDFNPGPGTFNASSFGTAAFILKLDAAGNFVWMYQFGGNPFTAVFGYAINLDGVGNIVVTGEFNGTVDFNPYVPVNNLTSAPSSMNIFIVMLDILGNNCPWVMMLPVGRAYDIARDPAGYIYCTGYFTGTGDFDPGFGIYNLTSVGGTDGFICVFNPLGAFQRATQIGSTGNEEARACTFDAAGNLYSTGFFSNTTNFVVGAGSVTLTSSGAGDIYVAKYNTFGGPVWLKQVTSDVIGTDFGSAIALDASNNVYVAGSYNGWMADFDPGPGTYTLSFVGGSTSFVWKLDNSGNFIAVKDIPCTGLNMAFGMALDAAGSVYTTGYFSYTGDFEPDVLTYTMTSNGSDDAYIQKLNICVAPPTPTNTTAAANLTICANNSTTLTANGTGTLNWFTSPTGTVSINTGTVFNTPTLVTNTTYYVESLTCGPSITRAAITVTVKPSPNITVNSGSICAGNSFTMIPNGASTYTFSSGSAVVSPTANTTYSVSGTSTAGCVSSTMAISSVTVKPLPVISVNSGSVCFGNQFVMIPSGASTYTFSSGSATVTPTVTSSYSVSGTSVGCVSASPAVSSVTVNPLPVVTITPPGTVCPYSNVCLSVNAATSYTWTGPCGFVSMVQNPCIFSMAPFCGCTFTASITDFNSCTNSGTTCVNFYPAITVTAASSASAICNGQTASITSGGAISYTWSTGSNSNSISVSPTTTTIYSVVGTNTAGCKDSTSVSLTVNPNPIVIASTPSAVCAFSTVCLSAGGAMSYNWAGPCGFSSMLQNPCFPSNSSCMCTYTVFGIDANNCTGTATTCINIVAPTLFTASTTNSVLCVGQTATLTTSNSSLTYTWSTAATGSMTTVSPTTTTTYSVDGTNSNGCVTGATITQTVSTCAGVTESSNSNEINIFPNPTSGQFTLLFDKIKEKAEVKIVNAIGQIVLRKTILSIDKINLNISDQASGVYFVEVNADGENYRAKIVKE